MADDLTQDVSWPGVLGVASCQGCISHGISPSTFVLTTYPQAAAPEDSGDLVFSDGTNTVTLKDCRLVRITGTAGAEGQTWRLEIQDRRWRWRGLGSISGSYNQYDEHQKLVPWTIRSPTELATLCLDAMGEEGYQIDLPEGLSQADGADIDRYLWAGENFPQSQTNPPVVWDYTPPAEALARLCEQYGRRVVYQPNTDRVIIAQLGDGEDIPDRPCEVDTPSLEAPRIPSSVCVAGSQVRMQARFLLEPVGKEWDGRYVPINDLSYAPDGGWGTCPPPSFIGVKGTQRLAVIEAQGLARESVWKCYRITLQDPGGMEDTLTLPWYGPVTRRQQITLLPTKVDQVVPQPPNFTGIQTGGDFANRVLPDFYNGYSRDQPAVVWGSVARWIGSVLWIGTDPNTSQFQRVYVPFSVDPVEQMIVFAEPVYAIRNSQWVAPRLVLDTGCLVADPETNQIVRGEWSMELGGDAPPQWTIKEDVFWEVIGTYSADHILIGHTVVSEEEANARAQYYLDGMAYQYQVKAGDTRHYPGILPLDPDGRIHQISLSVGPGGPTTVASENSEHSTVVLPYPARRRNENLPPDATAAMANLADPTPRPPGARAIQTRYRP